MIYFTICSRNFLGYAETLLSSVKEHHPDATVYAVLCDKEDGIDKASLNYPLIMMQDLGIPSLDRMVEKYNITELNTSLKPFAFLYLFDKHPGETVVYLDPDILVTSRFAELEAFFEAGADCVLTPHITESAEFAEMSDRSFLRYGVYNLGFCALRDTSDVRMVVAWWARRLENECIIDLENGIFVDQKWADLLPAFIENTQILRHPGYNIAYWNLSQRRLALRNGEWTVNNKPIRFIHFSGNRFDDPKVFSRHGNQINPENTPELVKIIAAYREKLNKNGHPYYNSQEFAFSWLGSSGRNEHTPESIKNQRQKTATRPHLPILRSTSLFEFFSDREKNNENINLRKKIEMFNIPAEDQPFTLDGFCFVCNLRRSFQVSQIYASTKTPDGRTIPNWREHLNCLSCGTVNRTRGSLHILKQEFDPNPNSQIYITEQITPLFLYLKEIWPNISGSEYLGENRVGGEFVNGIRHEDIQSLSFPDSSFDLILSFDVLEHVPNIAKSFSEIARCLKPGGRLLFTVPFSYTREDELVRAVIHEDGSLEHLTEPEYHGNPVDPEGGALCFRYFGWSVIDQLRDAGFVDAEVLSYWSETLLHFGDPQFVITARRQEYSS